MFYTTQQYAILYHNDFQKIGETYQIFGINCKKIKNDSKFSKMCHGRIYFYSENRGCMSIMLKMS